MGGAKNPASRSKGAGVATLILAEQNRLEHLPRRGSRRVRPKIGASGRHEVCRLLLSRLDEPEFSVGLIERTERALTASPG